MSLRLIKFYPNFRALSLSVRMMAGGEFGSGAGKGGGEGGSIRKAGGKFGEMEAAREEEYFRKLQAKQMKALKESLKDTLKFHKEQLKDHEEAIDRHKRKIHELEQMAKKSDD